MTNKTIGKYGEDLAKNFLIKKGYEILELNFRYSRLAEIDIIAKKDKTIHFVEVKTRTGENFGTPFEAINKKKMLSIIKCANYYLSVKNMKISSFQIDAIGIVLSGDKAIKIDFIENLSL